MPVNASETILRLAMPMPRCWVEMRSSSCFYLAWALNFKIERQDARFCAKRKINALQES